MKDISKIISKVTFSIPGGEGVRGDEEKKVSKKSSKNTYLITLNGIAFVYDTHVQHGDGNVDKELIKLRRSGKLPHDVEIYKHEKMRVVDVKCNSSRPLSPYLVVEDGSLVIETISGAWKWNIEKLIKTGCIEFLSPREEELDTNIVCESVPHFQKTRKMIDSSSSAAAEYYKEIYGYTHCNIDPNQMFSVTGSICPFTNHQLAPRSIYQASMAKQALGFFNTNYHLKYTTTFKRLYKSCRPLSETMTYPIPVLDLFPTGQNAMVAFYCMPDNQEDAVVISEDFLEAKGLNFITYKTIKYSQPTQVSGAMEKFQRPPVRKNEDPAIYRNIEDTGFPRIDSYIRKGDCVVGKVLLKKDGSYNNSIYAQLDEEGFVEAIEVIRERDGQQILVKIRLRRYRKYQAGDKMALRYAQKGTTGRVVKREELLRIATGPNKGTYPHIVFNPLGFPSRQTVGLLIEGVENKAALCTGERANISSFQEYDLARTGEILKENGFDPNGMEDMETYDGKRIPKKICVVPLYEQALRHHEMEKDAFVAHGASSVQVDRMMKSSDEFAIIVCNSCGSIINNKICTGCDKSDPVVIYIPYTFKLLVQLLNGIGIDIKLKTEKKQI